MEDPQGILSTDYIHPADIDWKLKSDAELWHASNDGIPQAKAEMARREAKPQRIKAAVAANGARRTFKRP